MIQVKIEKIVPITDARDSFNKIIDEVDASDEMYVITKNGKPAAIVVGVHHLEKLTGVQVEELKAVPAKQESSEIMANEPSLPVANTNISSAVVKPAETAVLPKIDMSPVAEEKPALPTTELPELSADDIFGPIDFDQPAAPVSGLATPASPAPSNQYQPTVPMTSQTSPTIPAMSTPLPSANQSTMATAPTPAPTQQTTPTTAAPFSMPSYTPPATSQPVNPLPSAPMQNTTNTDQQNGI